MKKAKARALVLLALWLTAGLAFASLPGIAQAQIVTGNDDSGMKNGAGDPDQPDPSMPPPDKGALSQPRSNMWVSCGFELISQTRSVAPAPVQQRLPGRQWLESLMWAIKIRIGW